VECFDCQVRDCYENNCAVPHLSHRRTEPSLTLDLSHRRTEPTLPSFVPITKTELPLTHTSPFHEHSPFHEPHNHSRRIHRALSRAEPSRVESSSHTSHQTGPRASNAVSSPRTNRATRHVSFHCT
jgi:hypothetical protein